MVLKLDSVTEQTNHCRHINITTSVPTISMTESIGR